MKLMVINGPNINMLGQREPAIYGDISYTALCDRLSAYALAKGAILEIYQSNSEGRIIDYIQSASTGYDGIIINPAAYTHYSIAILDAIKATGVPTLEIHLSNIYSREEFRQKSIISPACVGQISGLGVFGYFAAVDYFINAANKR